MEDFLRNANPGMSRRFQLEEAFLFEDYDDEALLKILLAKVQSRDRTCSFDAAKTAIQKCLAKQRMRPNFGNAGAVDNLVSTAILRAEERVAHLPPAVRAAERELVEADFYIVPEYYRNPGRIFDDLIGCNEATGLMRRYSDIVEVATKEGRDPLDDIELVFSFVGSPGTDKTTVARRMGQAFGALGVLASDEVVQCSAADFSTGFVGQSARKTREIFQNARGGVLFVDEVRGIHLTSNSCFSSSQHIS